MMNAYDLFLGPIDTLFLRPHRRWLASQAHGKTLEIAIGTGMNLAYYPKNLSLTAVDYNPKRIKIAAKRAEKLQMDVVFVHTQAEILPFENDCFDTVLMTFLLCGVDDVNHTLDEALRVLKVGGKFLMSNHIRSHHTFVAKVQEGLDKFTIPRYNEHWTRMPLQNLKTKTDIHDIKTDTLGILESVYAVKR